MTFKDFYHDLPLRKKPPRAELIENITRLCDVSYNTVMRWIRLDCVPQDPQHRKIISDYTGIPELELFPSLKNESNEND